jgi:hypothetical protein
VHAMWHGTAEAPTGRRWFSLLRTPAAVLHNILQQQATHPSALSDRAEAVDATPRPDPPRPQNPVPPSCSAARHGRIRSQQNGVPVAATRDDERPPSPRLAVASPPRAPVSFRSQSIPRWRCCSCSCSRCTRARQPSHPPSLPYLPGVRGGRPAVAPCTPPSTDGRTDGRTATATRRRCVALRLRLRGEGALPSARARGESGVVTSARAPITHITHPVVSRHKAAAAAAAAAACVALSS